MDVLERLQKIAPISTWALFGAGMVLSVMQVGMVLLLWLGRIPERQLDYVGIIGVLQSLDLMAVIASLSRARVAVHGPGGFSADVESGAAEPGGAKVTVEVPKP